MNEIVMIIPPLSGEGIFTSSSYCRRPFDYVMFNNMAAILKQKYTVSTIDLDLDGTMITKDYIDKVRNAQVQIIFVTAKHVDKIVQKYIDFATCTSLVVGPGSNNIKDSTVFKIIGEPEYAILNVVDNIILEKLPAHSKLIRVSEFGDMSRLPQAAHDNLEILAERGGYPSVLFARGCNNTCTFCRSNEYYVPGKREYRRRPIEHIVSEIKALSEKGHSLIHLECESIEPGVPKDEVWMYLDEIKKQAISYSTFCNVIPLVDIAFVLALKDSGCKYVFIGIENSNDSILKEMHKPHNALNAQRAIENLNTAGIQFGIGFLPFNPYSTAQTLLKDIYFLRDITSCNSSHPWNICCFMNVCVLDEPYKFDLQVTNIHSQFQEVFNDYVFPQIICWEKELHIFPERYCPINPEFKCGELFDRLTEICMEHIYKDVQIKSVCMNDAIFLHSLMNSPHVLQRLNEVPTEQQDWIDAINEWSHDDDEEDYIIFDASTPMGWLGVNGLLGGDKVAYLKMVVLLPDYQGHGFGSFAIRELKCHLKHRGFEKLVLYTDSDNYKAQACYQKCGFQIVESLVETMSNGIAVSRFKMEACLL